MKKFITNKQRIENQKETIYLTSIENMRLRNRIEVLERHLGSLMNLQTRMDVEKHAYILTLPNGRIIEIDFIELERN